MVIFGIEISCEGAIGGRFNTVFGSGNSSGILSMNSFEEIYSRGFSSDRRKSLDFLT